MANSVNPDNEAYLQFSQIIIHINWHQLILISMFVNFSIKARIFLLVDL